LPLVLALYRDTNTKVESIRAEFEQAKPVHYDVLYWSAYVLCTDRLTGGHLFDLVCPCINRKKEGKTLPMFVEKTLRGPADALAKVTEVAKTFGLKF